MLREARTSEWIEERVSQDGGLHGAVGGGGGSEGEPVIGRPDIVIAVAVKVGVVGSGVCVGGGCAEGISNDVAIENAASMTEQRGLAISADAVCATRTLPGNDNVAVVLASLGQGFKQLLLGVAVQQVLVEELVGVHARSANVQDRKEGDQPEQDVKAQVQRRLNDGWMDVRGVVLAVDVEGGAGHTDGGEQHAGRGRNGVGQNKKDSVEGHELAVGQGLLAGRDGEETADHDQEAGRDCDNQNGAGDDGEDFVELQGGGIV